MFTVDIHLVATIRAKENYLNLATGFRQVFAEINSLIANPTTCIDEETYTFVFYLCSDYKVII